MRRIVVLTLFTSSLAFSQPAKILPGGAVLKPERPIPIRPLTPPPTPSAASLSAQMKPLAALVGNFAGATKANAKVSVQCQGVAADTWIRCDVAVNRASATVSIGWDERGKGYRAFVADNTPASTLYKGKLSKGRLVLSGPQRVTIDLQDPAGVTLSTGSEIIALNRLP